MTTMTTTTATILTIGKCLGAEMLGVEAFNITAAREHCKAQQICNSRNFGGEQLSTILKYSRPRVEARALGQRRPVPARKARVKTPRTVLSPTTAWQIYSRENPVPPGIKVGTEDHKAAVAAQSKAWAELKVKDPAAIAGFERKAAAQTKER